MKDVKTIILVIVITCLILVIQLRAYYFERELSKNGLFTIGRVDSIDEMPKLTNIYVSYYSGNVKFVTPERKIYANINKDDIGKFYEIKYLKSSPYVSRTNFSKQIIDTAAILEAGFSIEDIKK